MLRRRVTAVLVADALVAAGGALLLLVLSGRLGVSLARAPRSELPGSQTLATESLLVLVALTLIALAPLAAARLSGATVRMGVVAALGAVAAAGVAAILDPQRGSLMPLTFGLGVAAAVALREPDRWSLPFRGAAVVAVTGLALLLGSGWPEVVAVLLAFPAVGVADQLNQVRLDRPVKERGD